MLAACDQWRSQEALQTQWLYINNYKLTSYTNTVVDTCYATHHPQHATRRETTDVPRKPARTPSKTAQDHHC